MTTGPEAQRLTVEHFDRVREKIVAAHAAYLMTDVGRQEPSCDAPDDYTRFTEQKPISPNGLSDVSLRGLLNDEGSLEEFLTTGTHGVSRSIFWPSETLSNVDFLVARLRPSDRVAAIYTNAVVETDVFLKTHVNALLLARPIKVRSFATSTDVARLVSGFDAIILTDYPSALARFIRLACDAMEDRTLDPAAIRGTKLIARLTGERMSAEDLLAWWKAAAGLGFEVSIELRYGSTEFLGIGRSTFEPMRPEVRYELTNKDCFVEVLDPNNLSPIYEGRGIVCATAYRTRGTILYRYLLGDSVYLFEEGGRRYVRDITRSDALNVTGNTASLSDVVAGSRLATGLEVCIDVRKKVSQASGIQTLDVVTYVPSNRNGDLELARSDVLARLVEQLKIGPAIEGGLVEVRVSAEQLESGEDRRRKAWRLIGAD